MSSIEFACNNRCPVEQYSQPTCQEPDIEMIMAKSRFDLSHRFVREHITPLTILLIIFQPIMIAADLSS